MNFPFYQGLGRRNTYMRWLINYIRSCFCKHEWEMIFDRFVDGDFKSYQCKTYRCQKCGLSKRYKSS